MESNTCTACGKGFAIRAFLKNPSDPTSKVLQQCSDCRAMKTRAKKRRRDTVLGDLDPNLQTKRARRRTQLSFENSYGLCDNNWILEPKPPPLPTAKVNAPVRPNGPVRWDDGSQETVERRTREQARGRAARGARRGHSVEPLTPTPPQPQPPPSSDFGSDIEFDFDFVPAYVAISRVKTWQGLLFSTYFDDEKLQLEPTPVTRQRIDDYTF
jgi:hypothetical protein